MENQKDKTALLDNDATLGSPFEQYMKEVSRHPILSNEECTKLIEEYRHGNSAAKEKLINSNLRLVVSIAKKYYISCETYGLLDIIQEGNFGLMRSIDDYDPKQGSFSTYATPWIHQAIHRALADKEATIRKPVHVKIAMGKYHQLIQNCKKNQQPIPSDEELLKILKVKSETLEYVKTHTYSNVISYNTKIENSDDETSELVDFLPDSSNPYSKIIDNINDHYLLTVLKHELPPLIYYILYHRIIAVNGKTLEATSSVFSITRERVRQLEVKAKKKATPYIKGGSEVYTKAFLKLKEKYGTRIEEYDTTPLDPEDIIKFLYVKDSLTPAEQLILKYDLLDPFTYSIEDYAKMLHKTQNKTQEIMKSLKEKLKTEFSNQEKYRKFRKSIINNYGTKIFNINLDVTYDPEEKTKIMAKYENLTLPEILNLFLENNISLKDSEIELLTKYFNKKEVQGIDYKKLEKEINLIIFNYRQKSPNLPEKELYKKYQQIKATIDEIGQFILECFYFKTRPVEEFPTYINESQIRSRFNSLITKLERSYFNLPSLQDTFFAKEEYLKIRSKALTLMSEQQIAFLDCYYGLNGVKDTVSSLAKKFNIPEQELIKLLNQARNIAADIYYKTDKESKKDYSVYLPYLQNDALDIKEDIRKILTMVMIDNLSFSEIANKMQQDKDRIVSLFSDGIRKIDCYRFGIYEFISLDINQYQEFIKDNEKYFSSQDKQIIYLIHVKHCSKENICQSLNCEEKNINNAEVLFNKYYLLHQIKNVEIDLDDIIAEINCHRLESVLDETSKQFLSLYYGICNKYNPTGQKLSKKELKERFKISDTYFALYTQRKVNMIKSKKIGLKKANYIYISRDELNKILDDPHLPLTDSERSIICYLLELKGFPPKKISEIATIYQVTEQTIFSTYIKAIISIYKYQLGEIAPEPTFEEDIAPYLKYFGQSDSLKIIAYFKEKLTYQMLAERFNCSKYQIITTINRLKNSLYDLKNNKNALKFDFSLYEKYINDPELPYYGNLEEAKKYFELYFGMDGQNRLNSKEIADLLKIKTNPRCICDKINDLIISLCKRDIGLTKAKKIPFQEITEFYNQNKQNLTHNQRVNYFQYLGRIKQFIYLSPDEISVPDDITIMVLENKYPDCYFKINKATKKQVEDILKKYKLDLKVETKDELEALFGITLRYTLNAKELSAVFKLIQKLDRQIAQSETIILKKDLLN